MQFTIDEAVFSLFPRICFGVVIGALPETPPQLSELEALRAESLASLERRYPNPEALGEHSQIKAWRAAYSACGLNPKSHRPTHEALARRLLKSRSFPKINGIVDVYLTNQIEHLVPHGGYDLAHLQGNLELARSPGGEPFEPLGGGSELTDAGELVYRDAARVLTRRWNYRDCEYTKLDVGTRRFLLMIEGFEDVAAVQAAVEDLAARYRRVFPGAQLSTAVLVASAAARQHSLAVG